MARYTGPKTKIARKFGEPIFGDDKSFEKRNYPPGQHGNNKRRSKKSTDSLIQGIFKGDIVDLSRGITLIESGNPQHISEARKIVKACLKNTTTSIRIGITGVPGAGKSTFIEAYGKYLTEKRKKVAVLAVDPSSSVSKGSILGDKTRMETLVRNPNVFIRPSASGINLGGVAQKTRETIQTWQKFTF